MPIGESIGYIRKLRDMTQNYLDSAIGFTEKTAYVHLAQYESSNITQKKDYDHWRYHYPGFDTTQIWTKMSPKEWNGYLIDVFGKYE